MKEIYAITNQKGGVAKTTTAQVMAEGLVLRGFRVLAIDMDPQGNLSFSMGADYSETAITIAHVLTGEVPTAAAIQQTAQGDIIPSNLYLSTIEIPGQDCLRQALNEVAEQYDYIIIDTPPSIGILNINAYAAATRLIIPMAAEIFSVQGVYQLLYAVNSVREVINPTLEIDGILLTRYNFRIRVKKGMYDHIANSAANLNCRVYRTTIRDAAVIGEAQASRQGLFRYAPSHKVAKDYSDFLDEVLGGRK